MENNTIKAKSEKRKQSDKNAEILFKKSPHPFEDGARAFLDHVEGCARLSLMPPGCLALPDDEYEALKFASETLRPAFDELIALLIEPIKATQPEKVVIIYEKIWVLLGASFRVGVHGTVTNGAKNILAPQVADEVRANQAEKARDGRRLKSRQQELMTAIKTMANGNLVDSEKYAESIRDQVKVALSISKGAWPSTRTVRRAIKAILEECGEHQVHS